MLYNTSVLAEVKRLGKKNGATSSEAAPEQARVGLMGAG